MPRQIPTQNEQQNPEVSTRCRATTARGSRCSNPARTGSDVCGAHAGNAGRPGLKPSTLYTHGEARQTYGEIVFAIARVGMHRHQIARRVRMSPVVLRSWFERGEADVEAGIDSEFSRFAIDFWANESAFVTDQLQRIQEAAKTDWRAAFKLLETVLPDEFGPRAKIEHTGSIDLVAQHADQLIGPLMAVLDDLGVADDPRIPDLIEEHFTRLERRE